MTIYDKLTYRRDTDFMKTCRKVMQESGKKQLTTRKITEIASKMPAPGYYVTFTYALRVIRSMNNKKLHTKTDFASKRWEELKLRVNALTKRHNISDTEALARVLAQGGATSFFISPTTALRLYQRLRKRHLNEIRKHILNNPT